MEEINKMKLTDLAGWTPPEPERRNDEANARRWRGPLFSGFRTPLMWKDKSFKILDHPKSVTFPICSFCKHVVWEWPHFEEEVPANAICGQCCKEEQESQDRE
jgi:hypothetical protein